MEMLKNNIMKMNSKYISLLLSVFILSIVSQAFAQEVENDYQSRIEFNLRWKPLKKLKINVSPQLRLNENFSVSKYLLETKVSYKVIKNFYLGVDYRFVVNPREEKDTELSQRFGFSANYMYKINDFKPEFRLSYTNYADDIYDAEKQNFLRYKLSLEYDIPKNKFTPSLSAELYHQLDENQVYKMRYKAQIDYKLFKHNFVSVYYKLDYFIQEYKNKHIFGITYKLKL
ncbi:MAG: hypothetical protein C0598_05340 [Marinilabiliales bacterium]|nr:MAG: hypothetical protein C0598_05340 [Marinilabiliales bacterium]